jgi:DNA-binding XRE family transcriptional regulator
MFDGAPVFKQKDCRDFDRPPIFATYSLHTFTIECYIMMNISIIGGIMDYQKILGENIHSLRLKCQITQEQLAELCDLHRTYVGAMERGERNVSLNNIVKVAQALNVTPAELLVFDGQIKIPQEDK